MQQHPENGLSRASDQMNSNREPALDIERAGIGG
jgi:hypothetical protein